MNEQHNPHDTKPNLGTDTKPSVDISTDSIDDTLGETDKLVPETVPQSLETVLSRLSFSMNLLQRVIPDSRLKFFPNVQADKRAALIEKTQRSRVLIGQLTPNKVSEGAILWDYLGSCDV